MNSIYIILWQSHISQSLNMGFLPYHKIPKGSILREAFFSDELCDAEDKMGLKGVYTLRKYAEEHLKLERRWRKTQDEDYILWIERLEGKGSKK